MKEFIPGGSFLISRNLFNSAIWQRPPQYMRLFLWLIGRAAFQKGQSYKGHVLERGQLITTYDKMSEVLCYKFNKRFVKPSRKEIRIMLDWLCGEGMIFVKPLIAGTLPNWGRPSGRTRAYVGLLITVINYDTYQDLEHYRGTDKGRPSSAQGQLREECVKNDKTPSEFFSSISALKERYPDQTLIDRIFQGLASTRKTGQLADSVKLSILEAWDNYSIDRVMAGIETFCEKGCAKQGKNERYLLGIIKNNETSANEKLHDKGMQSSGSALLDDYYKTQQERIA